MTGSLLNDIATSGARQDLAMLKRERRRNLHRMEIASYLIHGAAVFLALALTGAVIWFRADIIAVTDRPAPRHGYYTTVGGQTTWVDTTYGDLVPMVGETAGRNH